MYCFLNSNNIKFVKVIFKTPQIQRWLDKKALDNWKNNLRDRKETFCGEFIKITMHVP